MNTLDTKYQDLLQDILDNGIHKSDRTGTGTLSIFGRQIRHNMKQYDDEMYGWKTIPAITGDVIFFPGYIRHRTQANTNPTEKRWVLTSNYMNY